MPESINDLPGADAAIAMLQAREAQETPVAPVPEPPEATPPPAESATPDAEQRAAPEDAGAVKTTTKPTDDTRADAKADAGEKTETPEAETPKPDAEAERKSKYERDAERLPKSWKAFNSEKEAVRAQQEAKDKALTAREAALQEREAALEKEQPTPEEFEAGAARWMMESRDLSNQAEAADSQGKFDDAERLREQARDAEVFARRAMKTAAEARSNPPSARQQARAARREAERNEWLGKAYVDFPDLAKADGALVKAARDILTSVPKHLAEEPYAAYLAVDIAAAKLAAARVPKLLAEVARLTKRNTELERATSPGDAGNATAAPGGRATFETLSPEAQRAELERLARETRW